MSFWRPSAGSAAAFLLGLSFVQPVFAAVEIKSIDQLLQEDGLNPQAAKSASTGTLPASIVPLVYAENFQTTVDQDSNTVEGTFTISNTDSAYVGDLHYQILLLSPATAATPGQLTPDNATIYDHVTKNPGLTLAPHEQRQISFEYPIPPVPTGDYRMRVQLVTSNDRSMGWATNPVHITTTANAYGILNAKEVQTASHEYGSSAVRNDWGPLEGVNVDPGQNISLQADLTNAGGAKLVAQVQRAERKLLTSNAPPTSTTGDTITVNGHDQQVISLKLQAPSTPGAYVSYVTLQDTDKQTVSSIAEFRYVVRGPSASIVKATLDASTIASQDIATVNMVLVGSSDRETNLQGEVTASILANGQAIGSAKQNVTLNAGTTEGTLHIPVTGAISGEPSLHIEVVSDTGQVLDTYDLAFTNMSPEALQEFQKIAVPRAVQAPLATTLQQHSITAIIGTIAAALLIALVLIIMQRHHVRSLPPMTMLVIALIGMGLVALSGTALASGIQHKFFFYTETVPWVVNDSYVDLFINSPQHNSTVTAGSVPFEARLWWAACLNEFHKGDILVFALPSAQHFSFDTAAEPASPPWAGLAHYSATFEGGGPSTDWGRAISYATTLDLSSFAPGSQTTIWTRAFTAARYGDGSEHVDSITNDFTYLNFSNPSPVGFYDGSGSCQVMSGWACDSDDYSKALTIHIYDGPAGGPASKLLTSSLVADQPREAAVGANCGGYNNHGFSFPIPDSLRNKQDHDIYAYAINVGAGDNSFLGHSVLNCGPAPTQSNVTVKKTAPATTRPGQSLSYLITATNNGPGPASNVVVKESIPAGLVYNMSVSSTSVSACRKVGSEVQCTIPSLAANTSVGILVFYDVPASMACNSTISDTASVGTASSNATTTVLCGGTCTGNSCPKPQCSDGLDNDADKLIDSADPGCHTDGNPNNPVTYDPNDDSEQNSTSSTTPSPSTSVSPTPTISPLLSCNPAQQTVFVGEAAVAAATNTAGFVNGTWSAPGGSPTQGSGSVFQTSYQTSGRKNVSVTAEGATATCYVTVFLRPSSDPKMLSCTPFSSVVSPNQAISLSVGSSSPAGPYTWSTTDGSPSTGSGSTFSTQYATTGSKYVTVKAGSQQATCSVQVNANANQTFECLDTTDNDKDNRTDIDDPACHSDYNASNKNTYVPTNNESPDTACSDQKDNDNDGRIDAADPACHLSHDLNQKYDPSLNSETDTACSDQKDNDGDGQIDAADPGCHPNNDLGQAYTPWKDSEENTVPLKIPGFKEN
jgi:uncharacterized repeat protein (TIGR01451 family)